MEHPPKKSTSREVVESAVAGAVGMVPVAGSPLAAAFQLAIGWKFGNRQADWLDGLAEAVDELQRESEEAVTFEELVESEQFVDAVVTATRSAHATHQQAKLEALRNAVLNTLTAEAPSLDEQARFFRLIDEITPAHLKMLTFFSDPRGWFDERGLTRPNIMGGQSHILEVGIPEFVGQRDWYDLLAADLDRLRLCDPALHVMMTNEGVWSARTTEMGNRFLSFVQDPRSPMS